MRGPILRVALTGGIATGKSYVLARFAERGAPTIDADVLAHRAVAPGSEGYRAVIERFGTAILQSGSQEPDPGRASDSTNGPEIDRARLGRIVFGNESARHDLEAIVHPAVYGAVDTWFAALERGESAARTPHVGIADIPLLYETGQDGAFDRVIVAACPPEMQLQRLMARNALTEADARQRISAQLPIGEKSRRADFVIDTSGTHAGTDRQVSEIWDRILSEAGRG